MTRLTDYREKTGLTQKQFAIECGWGKAQGRIGNYESGRRQPVINDMRLIVSTLQRLGVNCVLDDVFPPKDSAA